MKISSKIGLGLATLTAAGLLAAPSAHAQAMGSVSNTAVRQVQVAGFVSNPTTNSADFQSAVAATGDTVDGNVNFDAEAVGPSGPTFYTASDGVTIGSSGLTTAIQNGAGPGQGNSFNGPVSSGEGVHASSNFLFLSGGGSLTLSFASPVAGVGFSTIDLYNPAGANPVSITAYSGAGGTGTRLGAYSVVSGAGTALGTFNAVGDNFQTNNLYFMGAADTTGANTIGSLVLTDPGGMGDQIGIDNVLIARSNAPVPEASTTVSLGLLLALGMGGVAVAAKRKKTA